MALCSKLSYILCILQIQETTEGSVLNIVISPNTRSIGSTLLA